MVNGCTAIERAAEGAAAKVVREGRASTEGEGHGGGIVVARTIDDGRGEDSVWEGMVSIEGTVVTRTVDDGLKKSMICVSPLPYCRRYSNIVSVT